MFVFPLEGVVCSECIFVTTARKWIPHIGAQVLDLSILHYPVPLGGYSVQHMKADQA